MYFSLHEYVTKHQMRFATWKEKKQPGWFCVPIAKNSRCKQTKFEVFNLKFNLLVFVLDKLKNYQCLFQIMYVFWRLQKFLWIRKKPLMNLWNNIFEFIEDWNGFPRLVKKLQNLIYTELHIFFGVHFFQK